MRILAGLCMEHVMTNGLAAVCGGSESNDFTALLEAGVRAQR
jgi:hypothetical protein